MKVLRYLPYTGLADAKLRHWTAHAVFPESADPWTVIGQVVDVRSVDHQFDVEFCSLLCKVLTKFCPAVIAACPVGFHKVRVLKLVVLDYHVVDSYFSCDLPCAIELLSCKCLVVCRDRDEIGRASCRERV